MSSARHLHIVVAVDPATQPIQGWLQPPTGPTLAFVGWIGLAHALERAIEPRHRAPASEAERQS